jgi:CBS domain-containing protein
MRAMDVMTTNVITIDPNTSVQALAALLSERGISGVPVVDSDNRVIGVVSEGDLLHRIETGTERRPVTGQRRSWWLDAIASNQDLLARDYVKSHGRTVKDVMTPDVISVADTTELAEIAMLLETKRIKRVPVVRDGKLVGIVSRANLVRALAAVKNEPVTDDSEDRAIRDKLLGDKLLAELKRQKWADIWAMDILVRDRVVHLWFSGTSNPKGRGGRCVLPPRTSQGFSASKSTSSRPPDRVFMANPAAGRPVPHRPID